MPSRFERYRVKDGVTVLGAQYFNPVWQDLDLRLATLEALRLSWEQAVDAVTRFGLIRINEVIGPALADSRDKSAEIEHARAQALSALAQLQRDVEAFEQQSQAQLAHAQAALQGHTQALSEQASVAQEAVLRELQALGEQSTAQREQVSAQLQQWQQGAQDQLQQSVQAAEAALSAELLRLQALLQQTQTQTDSDLAALQSALTSTQQTLQSQLAQADAWMQTQLAALQSDLAAAQLQAGESVALWQQDTQQALQDWQSQWLDALERWQLSLTQALPGIEARLQALEAAPGLAVLAYEARDSLRYSPATAGQLVLIEGLGWFAFDATSTEPDDDESCLVSAGETGRWLLQAAHWDVLAAWTLAEHQAREMEHEALEERVLALEPLPAQVTVLGAQLATLAQSLPMIGHFARVLCPITAVAAGAQVSFTVALEPAQPGDLVLVTPGDALGPRVTSFARVSAPGTVTVYLNNPSSSTQSLAPATWSLGVFSVLSAA